MFAYYKLVKLYKETSRFDFPVSSEISYCIPILNFIKATIFAFLIACVIANC